MFFFLCIYTHVFMYMSYTCVYRCIYIYTYIRTSLNTSVDPSTNPSGAPGSLARCPEEAAARSGLEQLRSFKARESLEPNALK